MKYLKYNNYTNILSYFFYTGYVLKANNIRNALSQYTILNDKDLIHNPMILIRCYS